MNDVLPLVGDGDELDFLQEIERTFAIKLPQDLRHCHTVGDLHDVLIASIPHAEMGKTSCLAAKAYFVLRRAIRKLDPGLVIRPSTELASIIAGRADDYRLCRQLKEDTGLKMRTFSGSWAASMLVLASIGLPLVGYAARGSIGALIAVPVSIGLLALLSALPSRWPARLRTVRDLARAVAALNVAVLASPNEPLRKREIWTALRGVIQDNLDWNGPVLPTTRLIRNGYTGLRWVVIGAGLGILTFLVGLVVGWLRVHFIPR